MWPEQASMARWVEIDLDTIASNVSSVKQLLAPEVKLLAVVKADGYGLGLVQTARVAVARGAAMLGVTHPGDGVVLREAGIAAPVLVFRPLLPGEEEAVVRYRLTPSIGSLDQARRLAAAAAARCSLPGGNPCGRSSVALQDGYRSEPEAGIGQGVPAPGQAPWDRLEDRPVAAHLKIETGMRRTGFTPASLREAMDELLLMHDLRWEGVYTHFADATDASFTRRQYRIFESLVEELPQHGLHVPLRHVCNSAATLLYPELHLEMVRVGTLLYGQLPAGIRQPELPEGLQLNNPWSLWARVVHLQPVRPGDSVGYGRTHRVRRKTVLAVLPVGYSDGFGLDVIPRPAGLIDLLKVLAKIAGAWLGIPAGQRLASVNGHPAPLLGRIGMELSYVDVGKIAGVEVGAPVRLPSRRIAIRDSVPRVYVSGGAVERDPGRGSGSFDRWPGRSDDLQDPGVSEDVT